MRNVFNNDELAHVWAHGVDREIRNSNGSIFTSSDGQTVYSYGRHFPMAKRVRVDGQTVFLVNPDSYSVTTSKHQSDVMRAIRGLGDSYPIAPNCWDDLAGEGAGLAASHWYTRQIEHCIERAAKPRIRQTTRDAAMADAMQYLASWRETHGRFSLRVDIDSVTVPDLDEYKEAAKRVARERKAEAKRQQEIAEERNKAVRQPHIVNAWRQDPYQFNDELGHGIHHSLRNLPEAYLRIDETGVVTSHGARVGEIIARQALQHIGRMLDAGQLVDREYQVGHYGQIGLTEGQLVIGCHHITWEEVGNFCRFYGWTLPDSMFDRSSEAQAVAS